MECGLVVEEGMMGCLEDRQFCQLDPVFSPEYKTWMGRRTSIPEEPSIDAASKRQGSKDPVLAALWTPVPNSRQLVQLALQMPRAYVRVLKNEGMLLNLSNYQVVEFLFLAAIKEPILE